MSHGSPLVDPPPEAARAGDGVQALDVARRLVVERELVPAAFGHLTVDAFTSLPFSALGPTKFRLKRFFSTEPWTAADADALAEAVGAGEGQWSRALDDEITLHFGWEDGRFAVWLSTTAARPEPAAEAGAAASEARASEDDGGAGPAVMALPGTFDGPVVPEATPNPRTIRFRTGPIHEGESRWFDSPQSAREYWRAARLFDEFPEVANILVGPDFVAVSLRRAADWEGLLPLMVAAVTDAFAGAVGADDPAWLRPLGSPADRPRRTSNRATRLAKAWADLGPLQPAYPEDLELVLIALRGEDPFHRQVAANLLLEAEPAVAAEQWGRLLGDASRAVRRATADAMADAGRGELRPLLERALGDEDGWVRWKALRGLAELGPGPSVEAIEALASDPDFRVRLEVANILRPPP